MFILAIITLKPVSFQANLTGIEEWFHGAEIFATT